MGNWFDDRAKSAARRIAVQRSAVAPTPSDDPGLTRRDILKRGGVVAGVAWTAPVLMSVMTPAAAESSCPTGQVRCPDTSSGICCAATQTCFQGVCTSVGAVGGNCTLNLLCNVGIFCGAGNLCGGSGAVCTQNSNCMSGSCTGAITRTCT